MGVGSPKIQLGGDQKECFSAISERDRWLPLCGRDQPRFGQQKRGRASMRTGALECAAPHRPDASQCAPTAFALPCQQRIAESTTEARCLPCPARKAG